MKHSSPHLAPVLLAALFSSVAAQAGDIVWTGGAGDGKWSTTGNWRDGAAPSAASDVALFSSDSDIATTFDLSVSPVIRKIGAGKLTLSGGSAYNGTDSNGSIFLFGGSIDLGGGRATIKQTSADDPVIADGTALYNATITYTSAYNPGPALGLKLPEGTVTFGSGTTVTDNSGYILSYGTPSGGATGERAVILDGATYNVKNGIYVCGANTSSSTVNDGTYFPTTLELKNGATLKVTDFNKTVRVGASFNGNHSPVNAAGILRVVDSTVVMNCGQIHLNDVDHTKGGNQNCYGLIYFENSTLTFNGVYNRPNLLTSNRDSSAAAHSYAEIVLKKSTATLWCINAMSLEYTGELTNLLPNGYTGILRLDGATLIPRGARSDFIYNSKLANRPCVKLEGANSVIDTSYDVVIPAVAFGSAGWTKKGSGTLTLAGENLYTGTTRVEAGTLTLTGSLAGGIEVVGGSFTTTSSDTYPSLLINGGSAAFTGATPSTFTAVEIGANGGTLAISVPGFSFNGVTGTANLSALTLDASPSGWGTGEVLYSDSADFLDWATAQLNDLLPAGFSATASSGAVSISASVAAKTTTWTGSGADALWSTAANWDNGAPSTADTVILDGTAKTATTLADAIAPASVTFAQTAGEFAVSGAGSLAISGGVTNFSDNAQTFNVPVTLSGVAGFLHAEGDIAFPAGLAATSVTKTGDGTAILSHSYTGTLDIRAGGIALIQPEEDPAVALTETPGALVIGGLLDLGGGTLSLSQPDSEDFILRDNAVLTNGVFNYASAVKVYNGSENSPSDTAFMWNEGTITIAKDATVTHTGSLFPYGPSAPAATFGARRLLVDGGTLRVNSSKLLHIIGVDNDWTKDAVLEVVNGGQFISQSTTQGLTIGARYSGTGTSRQAKGSLIISEGGSATLGGSITVVNAANDGNCYGHIAITNGTLTVTHQNGVLLFGYPWAQSSSPTCDAAIEVDGGVIETKRMVTGARPGQGKMAGRNTGTLHLNNGGTIRALANDTKGTAGNDQKVCFFFNDPGSGNAYTNTPAVELLEGGGVLDSNGHTITAEAVFYGPGSLTKSGAGTLTLASANTFTGGMVVSNGTLRLAAGASLASGVTVKEGATFSVADPETVIPSFTLEEGGLVDVSAWNGSDTPLELFRVSGAVNLGDYMLQGGVGLMAHPRAGVTVVMYGKKLGVSILLR